jgi:hypothetical protein
MGSRILNGYQPIESTGLYYISNWFVSSGLAPTTTEEIEVLASTETEVDAMEPAQTEESSASVTDETSP